MNGPLQNTLIHKKTPPCFLGAYSSFLSPCLQVTKNFNQMKDRAFFFKACWQRVPLYYFTTLWAVIVIGWKWEAGIFLTRALSQAWGCVDRESQEPPGGVSKGLLEEVWPVGPGARDDGSCEDSPPTSQNMCCVEFPSMLILVKSRASYVGCRVEVWCCSARKIYLFP